MYYSSKINLLDISPIKIKEIILPIAVLIFFYVYLGWQWSNISIIKITRI